MPRSLRLLIICGTIIFMAASSSAQTDLTPLFSEPTAAEIEALQADWASRPTEVTDFVHERYSERDGFTISRGSFTFEGLKQYALVRFPLDYVPGGTYPVFIFHHGGTQGFYYASTLDFDITYPRGCIADSAFFLAPTYRGEAFNGGDLLSYRTSDGEVSVWDRDCDDAMAMLTSFLAVTPEADPQRLFSFGRSRGATVAYHMAVRDPRLRRSVAMFGATNFRHEDIIADCQLEVDEDIIATNTLSVKVMQYIVGPWLSGEMSLQEARHLLNGWSIRYTLNGDVSIQIHHGEEDDAIVIDHAYLVDDLMQQWGAGAPEYQFYTYPNAGHNPAGMYGYEERVEEYVCLPGEVDLSAVQLPGAKISITAWPNPFITRVHLQVAGTSADKTSTGSMWIVDLRGRRVRHLEPNSSSGSFVWDGRDQKGTEASAGVYLAIPDDPSLKAGVVGKIHSKRILKLR